MHKKKYFSFFSFQQVTQLLFVWVNIHWSIYYQWTINMIKLLLLDYLFESILISINLRYHYNNNWVNLINDNHPLRVTFWGNGKDINIESDYIIFKSLVWIFTKIDTKKINIHLVHQTCISNLFVNTFYKSNSFWIKSKPKIQ
jgi:hypothetical protein